MSRFTIGTISVCFAMLLLVNCVRDGARQPKTDTVIAVVPVVTGQTNCVSLHASSVSITLGEKTIYVSDVINAGKEYLKRIGKEPVDLEKWLTLNFEPMNERGFVALIYVQGLGKPMMMLTLDRDLRVTDFTEGIGRDEIRLK